MLTFLQTFKSWLSSKDFILEIIKKMSYIDNIFAFQAMSKFKSEIALEMEAVNYLLLRDPVGKHVTRF